MAENNVKTPAVKVDVQALVEKMKAEGKKIITFSLKQKYFDAILAGRKVQEFREIRPTTVKRLIQLDANGFDIEDEDGFAIPIKYDAILFYTGKYEAGKKRDCALVEITDSLVQYLTDEEGKIIEYKVDYNGQKDVYWQESRVVYQLGTILAVNIFDQSKTKNVL